MMAKTCYNLNAFQLRSLTNREVIRMSLIKKVFLLLGVSIVIFLTGTLSWKILLISLAAILSAFLIIYFFLAPNNKFFTFVYEGTAKGIVRGGEIDRYILRWKGHHIEPDGKIKNGKGKETWLSSLLREMFGGLVFYGIWPIYNVEVYELSWTGMNERGEVDKHVDEELDYVMVKDDIYYVKVVDAEDEDLLPLEMEILLTFRVINPYLARHRISNYVEAVINLTRPAIRDVVTTDTFRNLIRMVGDIGPKIFMSLQHEKGVFKAASKVLEDEINNLVSSSGNREDLQIRAEKLQHFLANLLVEFGKKQGLIPRIRRDYGIEIVDIAVKGINPPPEYREVILRQFTAQREAEKVIVEADAEKARIERVYGAIKEFGSLGKLMSTLEAIRESPLATSLAVTSVPGLTSVIERAFDKPIDQVTSQDLGQLRGILDRIEEQLRRLESEAKSG